MEGPYRDLGGGFARLMGAEGLRRGPKGIRSVEDALSELLRNSRDAGARNVYVASSLKARRYRQLVVLDDGAGIPETHERLIFEPGVTSRHLNPVQEKDDAPHGAGLSLYHIKSAAILAEVLHTASPTTIKVVFDTRHLPEKSLQSETRPSKTNLPATLARFAASPQAPRLYHASPARILARLLEDRIIQKSRRKSKKSRETGKIWETAGGLGLEVSLRTVQRVVAGEVLAAEEVVSGEGVGGFFSGGSLGVGRNNRSGGPILSIEAEDLAEIAGVLRRAAESSYLELSGLKIEKRPGEVVLRARVYEPEEEYE